MLCFISYIRVSDLDVQMCNYSYVPVLGRGTAVFLLNGNCFLIWNFLHVPGLAVPLYSLHAYLQQRGCGFIGTFDNGFHVYFPTFILLVDTSSNCHLSYEPLGKSAPLRTLQYVQLCCAARLYPSKTLALSLATTPLPMVIEDDGCSLGWCNCSCLWQQRWVSDITMSPVSQPSFSCASCCNLRSVVVFGEGCYKSIVSCASFYFSASFRAPSFGGAPIF